jgi:uncharacterized protein DUF3786
MSKKEAQKKAVRLAIAKLGDVDITSRTELLRLPCPENGVIYLRVFGQDMELNSEFALTVNNSGKPAKPDERILLLHYLTNDFPGKPTGDLISFRELTGGQFYWEPFQSRSVKPLVGRIGNNLDLLKDNLNRFDWEETNMGDFSAQIHVFGNIFVTLIYHLGDDEFPADAELLFDSSIKRFLPTEDAAVIASRICIGLL